MVVEWRLHERAGVEEAHVVFTVQLARWRNGLTRHDTAAEAAEARRIAPGIQIHAVDQGGVDHRRSDADVKQQRDPDPVQEVAHVAGRRAAHEKEGQPRDDRRHARHDLERAEWIAKRAGDLPHFRARQCRRTRRLDLHPSHLDLHRVRLASARGVRGVAGGHLVTRRRLDRRGWSKHDLDSNPHADRDTALQRRLEPPGARGCNRGVRERCVRLVGQHRADRAVGFDR